MELSRLKTAWKATAGALLLSVAASANAAPNIQHDDFSATSLFTNYGIKQATSINVAEDAKVEICPPIP